MLCALGTGRVLYAAAATMRLSTAAFFLFGASRGAAFGGLAPIARHANIAGARRSLVMAAAASLTGSGSTSPIASVGLSSPFAMAHPSTCPTSRRISQTLLGATHSALYSRGGSTASSSSSTALNSAVAEEMEKAEPVAKYRKDYRPLPHQVTKISMDFDIHDGETTVTSRLTIEPNAKFTAQEGESSDLVLDGDETSVSLISLSIDGKDLEEGTDYVLAPGTLTIKDLALKPGAVLESTVKIVPEDNTQLAGLYKSGSMYCSQCEATGFRRITYYPDRPDNMAVFESVRIEADEDAYPALLSNGNKIGEGKAENGRHYSVWSDPFPKPSYLFCVVAGNLGSISDTYTTSSGREVHLEIFSEHDNVGKLDYAMDSLKRSMKWDEDKFGLEYDLDLYNIVAVNDFNMGAMENKGLNVFNTAYVLADQATASDVDYERVEGVIGHEYFHNWTGNRVTCRDWFQLTLKEGLTVFRDQEFSGDMGSNSVKRIEDVRGLRGRQFNEDAGPMAHPVRPESYISMDNFYTATVYSKGAEVVRMYSTLLGIDGFRKGMDLYFERHDGTGVTCDDFRAAMADANDVDLEQFGLWYSTPGTPVVSFSHLYDDETGTFSLTLSQSSKSDQALHIPVSVGLLDKSTGEEVVPTQILELRKEKQTFEFPGLKGDVIPSILRDFSAPVKLVSESGENDEESLAFLAARDTDGFNRWEAGQVLYTDAIFQNMRDEVSETTLGYVHEAFSRTLGGEETTDYSIQAYALTLPSESTLAEEVDVVDPIAIHKSRGAVKKGIARKLYSEIKAKYDVLTEAMEAEGGEFKVDATSIGRRRLRNVLLDYLCSVKETAEEQKAAAKLAWNQFEKATGMTDRYSALSALASMDGEGAELRDRVIQIFFDDAKGDALVLNKWFTVQALADLPDVLDRVKELTQHPDFTLSNPNRCRSLISAFTMNSAAFHATSGEGYNFVGDTLMELDKLNPQISSRMGSSLIQWKRYDADRGALMKAELERVAAMKPISDDLSEILSSALK